MTIKITLAKKPEQIDAIFKLRHQLLSHSHDNEEPKQKQSYLNDNGRNLNRFDGYPTTSHLIVENDGKVVGSLRLCVDSSVGTPANLVYDFRDKLPYSYQVVSCDMYCVSKNYHTPKIAQGLILMASYIASAHHGTTHLIASINPAVAQLMQKIGCQIVDKEMLDPATGMAVVPVLLDISTLKDFFITFAKVNQLHNFLGAFECVFFEEGDYIIRAGEKGDCVYVMVDGEANVIHPRKFRMVNTLKAGDVFGEIALLTDGIRKANVVAKNPVRAMRLGKTAFMDYLLDNPEKAIAFMTQISKQTKQIDEIDG